MDPNDYEPVPPRQRKKPKVKESIIDHTYRDYSQVEVSSDDEAPSTADVDKKSSRLQPNFPAKLHAIVSNPNYQHIICWQPHGRSWKIVDKHLLSTVICPKHFAHAKFESFNRSVNGWGFKRLLNPGPDCKSYYHECFLRGRPELTKLMQRLVNPGKRLPDKAGEPDFYEISRKYPLPAAPAPTPEQMAVMSSPMGRGAAVPGAGQAFFPGAPQAGGYPYGYYPAGPYPGQMPPPSPSTAATAAAGGGQPGAAFPPQPPQGAYWPQQMGQVPPGMYPPNPAAAYGYYPYPQMMGAPPPQGYEQYPHPAMYGQYYPPGAPGAPGAPPAASPGRAPGAQPATAAAPANAAAPAQTAEQQPGSQQTDKPAAATEADGQKEQKPPAEEPPAEAGSKRPLEDSQADPADTNPPPAKPTDSIPESSEKKALEEAPVKDEVKSEEPAAAQQPTVSAAAPSASPSAAAAPSTAPEKDASSEGGPKTGSGPSPQKGEGANEQQLLQDFSQQY